MFAHWYYVSKLLIMVEEKVRESRLTCIYKMALDFSSMSYGQIFFWGHEKRPAFNKGAFIGWPRNLWDMYWNFNQ